MLKQHEQWWLVYIVWRATGGKEMIRTKLPGLLVAPHSRILACLPEPQVSTRPPERRRPA